MEETYWQTPTVPGPMLVYLGERATVRKLRLWGCACVRRLWMTDDKRLAEVLAYTEALAEGRSTGGDGSGAIQSTAPAIMFFYLIRDAYGENDWENFPPYFQHI